MENVSQAIASRLLAAGDEVLVICADDPKDCPDFGDGVPVRRLPWRIKIGNTNVTPRLPFALFQEPWDVVQTHVPTPWSADWSVLVARILGRGSVVYFHNEIVGEGVADFAARVYNATIFRFTLRLADRVVVISEAWRDYLIGLEPRVRAKTFVITNGVDLAGFPVGDGGDGTRLLFVGVLDRFHRYKGLDVLLDALAEIDETFELTVIGDGELREEYEGHAARLGLADRVRFIGRVSDEVLRESYAGSDVYILPSDFSKQEGGFTLTALEAMASGLPVVLAEGAGQLASEAEIHGAGFRVPAGDAVQLASALRELLENADRRKAMGRAAREYVELNHSWDEIALERRAIAVEAEELARRRRRRTRGK